MREEEGRPLVNTIGGWNLPCQRRSFFIGIGALLCILIIIILIIVVSLKKKPIVEPEYSSDPYEHARQLQSRFPLVDGHNDLPWALRNRVQNQLGRIDLRVEQNHTLFNTDIPRLREGLVGGQFWSVYVPCSTQYKDAVRMTMEQIDVVNRFAQQYSDVFQLAYTAQDVRNAFAAGKIGSLIGMEGGHSIDSSLAALRLFYNMGARYMTLTHNCNTPWVESCCDVPLNGDPITPFGYQVLEEMNRLGMLIDISHVSQRTMRAVLQKSKAPIIFSHSDAYGLCNIARNVPDDVLAMLPNNGGVVMVNFYTVFVNCSSNAVDLEQVVNHIDYIVQKAGIDHVGIGGDFDGVGNALPVGLEDVSKYPSLTAALIIRGYSNDDIVKIIGGNVLRVLGEAEQVARQLQSQEGPLDNWINYDFSNITCRSSF